MATAPLRGSRVSDERRVLGVGDATRLVRSVLEGQIPPIWVAGEVSNLRRPTSGHIYLTLKDPESQLRGVIWRTAAARVPFRLEDGLEVICYGKITVYEPRGEYQISIEEIEPKGIGAAQLALEQLKRRLLEEGLFDPARKRSLPRFPGCIGLVTSATGAAVRDIMEVIERRCPKVRVILCPVRVQGDGAAREVAAAIEAISRHGAADVLIVGRGGGSQEDLWAFNDEGVARAIARCRMPVISSVGHAIDTTVADLVADRRALTPTEAAELATPLVSALIEALESARERLRKALMRSVRVQRERLDLVAGRYAFREPADRIRRHAQRLDEVAAKLPREVRRRLAALEERLGFTAGKLEGLSPLQVLGRGYSVTTREGDLVPLRDAAELAPGDRLRTRLARGEVVSEVVSSEGPRDAHEPVDLKSFEKSFEELEGLVRQLEGGSLTLDDSLAHYERGVSALKRCYRILEQAEKRLELLVREGDGSLATKPVELGRLRGEARGEAKIAPAPAPVACEAAVADPAPAAPAPRPPALAPAPSPALPPPPAPAAKPALAGVEAAAQQKRKESGERTGMLFGLDQ